MTELNELTNANPEQTNTQIFKYCAVIQRVADIGKCEASFPDFPNLICYGNSIPETVKIARDAVIERLNEYANADKTPPSETPKNKVDAQNGGYVFELQVAIDAPESWNKKHDATSIEYSEKTANDSFKGKNDALQDVSLDSVKQGKGRPKLTKDKLLTKGVLVRFTDAEYSILTAMAHDANLKVAILAKVWIASHLNSKEENFA